MVYTGFKHDGVELVTVFFPMQSDCKPDSCQYDTRETVMDVEEGDHVLRRHRRVMPENKYIAKYKGAIISQLIKEYHSAWSEANGSDTS